MESNTPSPSQSSASPGSPSGKSAVATVCATGLCLYAIHTLAQLLSSSCEDQRWKWAAAGVVAIAVPTIARHLLEAARIVLNRKE
jgi:hypothetical protein